MIKKRLTSLIIILAIVLTIPTAIVNADTKSMDKSRLNEGLVSITYKSDDHARTKVTIKKGEIKYTYNLEESGSFPLTLGNGEYEVSVLENVSGNLYKLVEREKITLTLSDSNKVFLSSMQLVNWNHDMAAIKKAKALTKGLKTDTEKVTAIYNYIVSNYSYDYEKAKEVETEYIPSVNSVFESSGGICYDYSVLLAAMLRSVGVPTKLIMGYKVGIKEYHAWNQVYMKETDSWVTIDTTTDSILIKNDREAAMVKNPKDYTGNKQF